MTTVRYRFDPDRPLTDEQREQLARLAEMRDLAMYPAFCVVMLARGVPPGLAAFSLACFGNLCACLTNYGTTPAPMFFAQGYVSFGTWWRIGFIVSLVTLLIWSTVGFAWWKFLGIW